MTWLTPAPFQFVLRRGLPASGSLIPKHPIVHEGAMPLSTHQPFIMPNALARALGSLSPRMVSARLRMAPTSSSESFSATSRASPFLGPISPTTITRLRRCRTSTPGDLAISWTNYRALCSSPPSAAASARLVAISRSPGVALRATLNAFSALANWPTIICATPRRL